LYARAVAGEAAR